MSKYIRRLAFVFLISVLPLVVTAQYAMPAAEIKEYPVPDAYLNGNAPDLPLHALNHRSPYFPSANYSQEGLPSCGQASGIAHCLTYEFNRARDLSVDSVNYMAPLYPFSFLNEGYGWYGVSTMESWELIKSQGCASLLDYGDPKPDPATLNLYTMPWMNGYEKYYRAMHNRIEDYYSIDVSDGEGLHILKHFIANHLDGSDVGGTAIFYSGTQFLSGDFGLGAINDSVLCYPFAYTSVNSELGQSHTHSMTVAGYITNTQLDFNGDGYISDSLDINDDGIVDFHDNEKTLWIIVNSYSFMNYFSFLKYDGLSKVWDSRVFFPLPEAEYSPELTLRIKMRHPVRNGLRIRVGFSEDLSSELPERVLELPVFNFQGGPLPLTGFRDTIDNDLLEFGLDITDGLNLIQKSGEVRVFLMLDNACSEDAEILQASLISYSGNESEILFAEDDVLPASSQKNFSVIANLDGAGDENLLSLETNELILDDFLPEYEFELNSHGGVPPYSYKLLHQEEYVQTVDSVEFVDFDPFGWIYDTIQTFPIGFDFPFGGGAFDSLTIAGDLSINFSDTVDLSMLRNYPYPYISMGEYGKNQIYALNGFEYERIKRFRAEMTDSSLLIGLKYNSYKHARVELFPDGRIQMTYPNLEYGFIGMGGVNTANGMNYYSQLNTFYTPSSANNHVSFQPVLMDSVIGVSESGVVRVIPNDYLNDNVIYVQVEDSEGSSFVKRIRLLVTQNEDERLAIYPNPAEKEEGVMLNYFMHENGSVSLEVYSVDGKLMGGSEHTFVSGQNRVRLNISDYNLTAGIYLVRLRHGTEQSTSRLIIQ